ncbi:unnamed protein product [Phytophthora lilii]|uniref:Unnamed protein product n=1 Tax=Phytophthora lilii TaxID=2077276 RepID=A0A9W6X4V4_9STRA|nr:unnamed protein product [Phytophthora lilii]
MATVWRSKRGLSTSRERVFADDDGLGLRCAVVSLSYPSTKSQQGLLTIERLRVHGGTLEIPLGRSARMPTLIFASERDQQRCRFRVSYGLWHRCLTFRLPTPSMYEAWWAALETAYMSLHLEQISRALATNYDTLPKAEPDQETDSELEGDTCSALDVAMNNVPLLEVVKTRSTVEADGRDSWDSSESPDELIVIPSVTDSMSEVGSGGSAPKTKFDGNALSSVTITDVDSALHEPAAKINLPLDNTSTRSPARREDSYDTFGSLTDSDIIDSAPKSVRSLMGSYSSWNSCSTSSTIDSNVCNLFTSDADDLLDSRPMPSNENAVKKAPSSRCSIVSNDLDGSFYMWDGDSVCYREIPRERTRKSKKNGAALNDENKVHVKDVSTRSTMADSRDSGYAQPTFQAEKLGSNRASVLPKRSISTPFQRLLTRQKHRTAAKAPRDGSVGADLTRDTPSYAKRNAPAPASGNVQHQSRPNWITEFRPHPIAVAEKLLRQSLVIGRINEGRVNQIEDFASRQVPGMARNAKKTLKIERVTDSWKDVARFAFRPKAPADLAGKHQH